ncbi:thiamine phosphate synthase [Phenylobacterium sp. J367]|uniref:thiamine phosphate synthase n=1 Tax=Phenylobacterium sp. J367 TaxID=2898435 RepID=UPI0021513928|nr:thiamine phosphate synthase [Phenylobacterium sp. J367]MCR5878137.1 thiamine phosphate synthase [Phenylobacterium sp. J367]
MRRTAALLSRRAGSWKALPPLLFFTDPVRTPDPCGVAAALPAGSAVVFRGFGAADAEQTARALLAVARDRRLRLLIGADPGLAARIGADGVHLPERLARRAGPLKRAHPRWTVTAAAHSLPAARRAISAGADAAVISVAFASNSASAGTPLGPVRLARLARGAGGPVYALGGITNETARRLVDAGLVGLAAVEGLIRT